MSTPAAPVTINPASGVTTVNPAPKSSTHFSLGQFLGLALLGLSAYAEQNQPGSGPSVFLNPTVVEPYIQGVLSIFQSQQPSAK